MQDVRVGDSSLVWTRTDDGGQDQATVDELLFIWDLSQSGRGFVVCCLQEDVEQPTQPFSLLLLAADAVPDQLLAEHRISEIPLHLASSDDEVDVLVSTKSGRGLCLVFWRTVLRPLWSVAEAVFGASLRASEVVVTQDAQSVRRFARALQPPRSRTIVLLSGDGGVADLLNGRDAASDAPPPLMALLPLGTGNALFHSLHRPVSPSPGQSPLVLGLWTLFLGVPAGLPVFRASLSPGARIVSYAEQTGEASGVASHDAAVSSMYGAIVASYGFHASVVYESDAPEHRAHGDRRFATVAHELLRESHAYRVTLSDRRPLAPRLEPDAHAAHAYILMSLVSNLERAFTISLASRPFDGKLRLVHLGPISGARTMDVMTAAYDGGSHVGMAWDDGERVGYDEVDEVRFEALDDDARWRKFCVDGTAVEVPRGGSMTGQGAAGAVPRLGPSTSAAGGVIYVSILCFCIHLPSPPG